MLQQDMIIRKSKFDLREDLNTHDRIKEDGYRSAKVGPLISIIIPLYNEEKSIPASDMADKGSPIFSNNFITDSYIFCLVLRNDHSRKRTLLADLS